jgi:hypothetical protein
MATPRLSTTKSGTPASLTPRTQTHHLPAPPTGHATPIPPITNEISNNSVPHNKHSTPTLPNTEVDTNKLGSNPMDMQLTSRSYASTTVLDMHENALTNLQTIHTKFPSKHKNER